ncbi:unnamed protein product [Clonostachys rosea f. rosea IK726]|uniref:Cytochrome P450 n=2 Tax=Bionectria ochroleuca TaxID=29856 RepID=A0A0B7KND1_BIOOC|nr:unnamed protein product [Clonostachys rosea f. rosea IK726]
MPDIEVYGLLSAAAIGCVLVAATSLILRYGQTSSTGPSLPPTIMLEAGLAADRYSSSIIFSVIRFTLRRLHALLSIHHEIVPDVSHIEKVFFKQNEAFDIHPMSTSMLRRIFGCDFRGIARDEYIEMVDGFMKIVARDFPMSQPLQPLFIGGISGANFSENTDLQHPWEQLANTKVLRLNPAYPKHVVEADLESLLRGLSFHISIPLLYGHDYIDRNPLALWDWDCFGGQTALLALGVPTWVPIPSFRRGIAARDRLVDSISSVYRRTKQYRNGEAVDYGADMTDVSETALDRYKVYDRHGLSAENIGHIEFSLLWAQNKNTQQLLFWYIFYIYSVPGLLDSLRQELASSGVLSISADDPPRITRLDIGALGKQCPLLTSTFLESFRVTEESIMFRRVTERLTLDDGKDQYQLRPGSWLFVSTALTRHDSSIYPRPLEFLPDRFVEGSTASYRTLRPWGLGLTMCKGRTFAEKKVLAVAAGMIALWDIKQVGGEWQHPGFRTGATILAPASKLRVRIKRRIFD